MSIKRAEAKDEYLAQLGLKRGSSFAPWIALALVFVGLYLAFSPIGDQAAGIFAASCSKAEKAKEMVAAVAAGEAEALKTIEELKRSVDSPKFQQFLYSCDSGVFASGTYEQKIYAFSELAENHAAPFLGDQIFAFVPALVDLLKGYFRNEFSSQFVDVSFDLIKSQIWILAWTAGIALIPGLLGMIYRRAFWWWFGAAFIPLLILAEVQWFSEKTSTPFVYVLYLVALQLLILTFAFRLRRYSADTTGSVKFYNAALAAILIAVAVVWYVAKSNDLLSSVSALYQWEFILIGLPLIYSLARRSDLWAGTIPKNIVVCLDGTTNTPDQYEFGKLAQTNVFKLFKMLKSDATGASPGFNATFNKSYGDKQIALYYSGVGNRFDYNPIVQVLGGATGLGAAEVVSRAYLDIMRVYRPGDRIFLFGFSRGAAIARLLARAIDQQGAPQTIWALHLLGRHIPVWTSKRPDKLDLNVPVSVLGCWDTVGAFGVGKNIAGIPFQKLDLFKDLTVPDNVEQAYHMVALDELREEFQPTLMEPDPIRPGRIVEVWFSGDHANIGGGWSTTKLSDLTLDFQLRHVSSGYACEPSMLPGAETWGLYLSAVNANAKTVPAGETDLNVFEVCPDALGHLRRWNSSIYKYTERSLPDHAVISETVFDRMRQVTPLYAPKSLFNHHRHVKQRRESVISDISTLAETNSLSAAERDGMLAKAEAMSLTRGVPIASAEQAARLQIALKNPPPEPAAGGVAC
ncbi:MAG: hypothetical protein APF80_13000 [Alphaproteobacteria bacterium BRH_c36]|nr:MAG: hypothetical protein APF80_13000 [Alphaproteobacteria bacterium BRH_c36]